MATYTERLQAIGDALINGTATGPQQIRAADAFVAHWRQEVIALGYDPDALTNTQKAAFFIRKIKELIVAIQEAEDPDVATARDSVTSAEATANTEALTDWPEEVF